MAFDSYLPRNSESRAISMSLRLIKKYAPQIKWVISFADACSCGDGTIYRASNFVLTGIKENLNLAELPDGTRVHKMTLASNPTSPRKELGGLTFFDVTGGTYNFKKYLDYVGATPDPRLSAPLHLLHRQIEAQGFDGAGDSILQNRRAGRWNV